MEKELHLYKAVKQTVTGIHRNLDLRRTFGSENLEGCPHYWAPLIELKAGHTMKAWLITWETAGGAAAENHIASILSARTGPEDVRKYVEQIYADSEYSLRERAEMARYNKPRRNNPYPAEFMRVTPKGPRFRGQIMCGHNPYLYGRLVENIEIVDLADFESTITWDEIPIPDHVRNHE